MVKKSFKIATVILLLMLFVTNYFIFTGIRLASYATNGNTTNHQNVEFSAELKESNVLSLFINVKKEGYFNGEITLENSNFTFENAQSNTYINTIEENKIVLNRINSGTIAQFDLKIKPVESENFDIGLLNAVSKLNLIGTYKDSTERDISIIGTREVEFKYIDNNTEENIESSARVITNKFIKVAGEDKRVVQLEMNLGLKENNYPIKEIGVQIDVPSINGKYPEAICKYDLSTMKSIGNQGEEYRYNDNQSRIKINLYNEPDDQNKVRWLKNGNEKIVLTFIYDEDAKDATIEDVRYARNLINVDSGIGLPRVNVTLYNERTINKVVEMSKDVLSEEKEELVSVTTTNLEDTIYKGKLYAGIDRQYESKTNISVNLANAEQSIDIKEWTDNVVFNKTVIKKDSLEKIFGDETVLGENGQIIVLNEDAETLATINKSTEVDDNGDIVIDYTGKEPSKLEFKTTMPVKEGNIEFINTKTIKAENSQIFKELTELSTKTTYEYFANEVKEKISIIRLEETKTEAELYVDKDSVSTVVENDLELKAILKGNDERYNLFENPTITFELPQDIEDVSLNGDAQLIYDNELKIRSVGVNDRIVTVVLEGKQTEYKSSSIEGTVLILNVKIKVNKRASTKDSQINMTVVNNGQQSTDSKNIKIVASKDVTVINGIKELNIETIGQEEQKEVLLQRGVEAKEFSASLEVINNNETQIENVKIEGTFPTKNRENNIDIKITEGISIKEAEQAEVYYTENENATDDIENTANGWNREILNNTKVKKYLIVIPRIDEQSSIIGTYKFEVPELLEYNQSATESYKVSYTNSLTQIANEIRATSLKLKTGVGPIIEAKLIPTIGGQEVKENTAIKNGEVVKFIIEVSNTGSENINNVLVTSNIPEGATLVIPQENYEYTGASYYKELSDRIFKTTIDNIGIGEVKKAEYEIRVNSDAQVGTILSNDVQVNYGDVTKRSNRIQLVIEKGDIRVSVKRVTDRNKVLYENDIVKYFAIVENISDSKQENVTVKTNLPSNFNVNRVALISGMSSKEVSDSEIYRIGDENTEQTDLKDNTFVKQGDIESEELEYSDNINIGSINVGESKVIYYALSIEKVSENEIKNNIFTITAKCNDREYRSNTIQEIINKVDISMNMTSNIQGQYVKSGDILEYTITINNNTENRIEGIVLKDTIPNSLTVKKVTFDGENVEQLKDTNNIEIYCNIAAKSNATIKIETVVNYAMSRNRAEAITNIAYAEILGKRVANTVELNHIIEANQSEDPIDDDTPSGGDTNKGRQIISGVAWLDENANGRKDDEEKVLDNIKVYLFNTETNSLEKTSNGNTIEATTNDKGTYILDNIKNGKYIVIFGYNQNLYTITKYKVENVEESKNSNVMTNELIINNHKQQVPSTDIIEIKDNNVSNINIGLIELKDFAFRLDKYVSRILIQNSIGTTVKEYTNATVAKVELDAKKLSGTNVIIEYEIKVTNVGEIDGYVRKIVDYAPNDLKFSSELNKEWYQVGSDLFSTKFANEKIPAGESRKIKLTLTKAVTENNIGLTNNTAEIAESYNELGIKDSKSIPGNKAQGEIDFGSADTILSFKTGGDVYVAVIAVLIAIIGSVIFIIFIRKQKIEDIKNI